MSTVDDALRCSDGDACTKGDRCVSGTCTSGGPRDCDDGNPCTEDTCERLVGCVYDSVAVQAAACDDGVGCTRDDRCERGFCVGAAIESDQDRDGYDDEVERAFGCRADDPTEIPPQPPAFAGSPRDVEEGLLTYATPAAATIDVDTDPSCRAQGRCGHGGFCVAGRVADPCWSDADCNPIPGRCRLVVAQASVPELRFAVTGGIGGSSPGCTRKVDVDAGVRPRRVTVRADGVVGGRRRRDVDRFVYR
jgi:hypothetical protein